LGEIVSRVSTVSISLSLILAVALGTTARAATITVNSLADPGALGICALRDAITAANSQTRVNGCRAGSGNDTINFSVSGTIQFAVPGAALEITDSQLTINGPITIEDNLGSGQIVVDSGAALKLKNVTIQGGFRALFSDGTVTIVNSTFTGNTFPVFNFGMMTVTSSTFVQNIGDAGLGPSAIGIEPGATLTVTNSTFSHNLDSAVVNRSQASIANSTFSDNASNGGSPITNNKGSLIVSNSTFSANSSFLDAGAITNTGELAVINSTFAGNISSGFGATPNAIDNSGSLSVKNSILTGSTDNSGNPIANCGGTITDAGYNISDDGSCEFTATGSLNSTNPGLSSDGLTNNGGPTQTIALSPGSPAIDAIPVADCTDQNGKRLKTDQRGFPRPDAEESVCDIGAFETQDGCSQNQQGNNNCQ
jgi:hypothetical protein